MAQSGVHLDRESFSCSICLDLLKVPVGLACGHSYCMDCIKTHWDGEDQKKRYSCPQCRQAFATRPVLLKNTMLADLVEQLKKTGLQAAAADHCFNRDSDRTLYAGPGDVACDFCTGRKLKAFKSCLVCLASYCETHLQPHYDSPTFKKHKLVEPSEKLQENLCPRHDEVMKIFCRTDQQCICYLCSMNEHKGHDTVSAAAERTERQRELEGSRLNIQQRITDAEEEVKLFQQKVEVINGSADKAVEHSEKTFAQMIRLIQKTSSDVKQQLRNQQEVGLSRVRDLQEQLEQEIAELKKRDAELKTLAQQDDHNQFLQDYHSLPELSEFTLSSSSICPLRLRYFEYVTVAVSDARDTLQYVLRETGTNISMTATQVNVLLPQPEPKTRADFLRYACKITMDPNTVFWCLLLSKGNTKATCRKNPRSYPSHKERFHGVPQVLSKESLTGRCYWEVEWKGKGLYVAVAYKTISRAGYEYECLFGKNLNSWSLCYLKDSYIFSHNNRYNNQDHTPISGPYSSRIGVYLDHSAGVLSFYSVSETMTLLHRVQTKFTQPLYAGIYLNYDGDSAEFSKLN